ncbi:MAG: DUF4177 domain-containing protein [Meiothermus sp.]
MYEYKFVRVPVKFTRSNVLDPATYTEAVTEHAAQGWRLVQILVENPAASVSEYVLIFERQKA